MNSFYNTPQIQKMSRHTGNSKINKTSSISETKNEDQPRQLWSTYANTYNLVVIKFFEENWFQFSGDCEILLNTKLIKPNDLLTILNQVNPNLQFRMQRSSTNLPLLDIMINLTGRKIWMNIYSKPTDSKRYVPFTPNHPRSCLRNIPLCLARRICTIVQEENTKLKRFSKLKTFKNLTFNV